MEQQAANALERIQNPILIILLVVLMLAVSVLWYSYIKMQKTLMDTLVQNIQAITNLNGTLSNMRERLDGIEEQLQKQH
jgi:LPS O-antigen subunit length determinant protein (WzzB/FepE family)